MLCHFSVFLKLYFSTNVSNAERNEIIGSEWLENAERSALTFYNRHAVSPKERKYMWKFENAVTS